MVLRKPWDPINFWRGHVGTVDTLSSPGASSCWYYRGHTPLIPLKSRISASSLPIGSKIWSNGGGGEYLWSSYFLFLSPFLLSRAILHVRSGTRFKPRQRFWIKWTWSRSNGLPVRIYQIYFQKVTFINLPFLQT